MFDNGVSSPGLLALILAVWVVSKVVQIQWRNRQITYLPCVGPTGFFSSYLGVVRFFKNPTAFVEEGYRKYPGKPFRIPTLTGWIIVLNGPKLTRELGRAAEDGLSFLEAVNETLQTRHTIGPQIADDPYHVEIVRGLLTRNIGARFPDIHDEIVQSTTETVPLSKEWKKFKMVDVARQIVCRTANRFFVDLPVCRDPDYINLNITFTVQSFIASRFLSLFPNFMRTFLAHFMTNVPKSVKRGMKHLGPLVQEALDNEEKYGKEYPDKPNNLISWLLTQAHGERRAVNNIVNTILALNVAAIHTTSGALTTAMYDLAVRPDLIDVLREEVETVIAEEGWTKMAMQKLVKLDSFIKESLRLAGVGAVGMKRIAVRDYTFSDGTFIPRGFTVACPSWSEHRNLDAYPQGEDLNPLMWANARQGQGEAIKHQMTNTQGESWQLFGHGRHACPGRFFAVSDMKAILSHIILHYDIKMENDVRPPHKWLFERTFADPKGVVMFKERSC